MLRLTGAIVLTLAVTACSGSTSHPNYCPDVKDAQTWLAGIDRARADTSAEPGGESIAFDHVRDDFGRVGFSAPRALKQTAAEGGRAAGIAAIKARNRVSSAAERRGVDRDLAVFGRHC